MVVSFQPKRDIINGEASQENSRGVTTELEAAQKNTFDAIFPDVATLEHALRDKMTQHVSKDSDRFRQAFRMYTSTEGITYKKFKDKTVLLLGSTMPDAVCRELFMKFDTDNSGDIDLKEFMAGLFPKGSSSSTAWNDTMRKGHKEERVRTKQNPPKLARGQWTGTAEDVERQLQNIISQRTSKESDRTRQAFKLFTSASCITPVVFERRIRILMGVSVPKSQCRQLFKKFDTDSSGDLDLAEFVSGLMPKDYTEQYKNSWFMQKEKQPNRTDHPQHADTEATAWQGTAQDVERSLQNIVAQRTSKESDRTRQAFKLFTSASSITPDLFQKRIGLLLGFSVSKKLCQELFDKYDTDKSGDIDLSEFVVGLMPKDYTHVAWNVQREDQEKRDLERAALQQNKRGVDFYKAVWKGSLQELEHRLQDTIVQHTTKGSDQTRQAFNLFTAARNIKPDMFKLGIEKLVRAKISGKQAMELFSKFDTDGSGDIDLQEFVAGLMPKDYKGECVFGEREDQRIRKHKDLVALGSVKAKWDLTLDDLQRRLQDKVVQRTSRASDQFRQAFRMFTATHNIKPQEFKRQIDRMMDADVPELQCQQLFERFDTDNSGDIDLQEFINGIMPKDRTKATWNINSDNSRRAKDTARRTKMKKSGIKGFHAKGMSHKKNLWELNDIEHLLQDKITQRTSKSSDQFRQAFKLFTVAGGITPQIFQSQIDKFLGTTISPEQVMELFKRYDTDRSGDIDLQEFVTGLMPKDYGAPPPVRKHPRLKDRKKEEPASVLLPSPPQLSVKRPQSTGCTKPSTAGGNTSPRRLSTRQQHQRGPEQNGMPGLVPAPPHKQNNNAAPSQMPVLQTPEICSKSDGDRSRPPANQKCDSVQTAAFVPHVPAQQPTQQRAWRKKKACCNVPD